MRIPYFSGKSEICLVGQDRNFIAEYLEPYWGMPKPIDASLFFEGGERIG
jgi:hypothetical protein